MTSMSVLSENVLIDIISYLGPKKYILSKIDKLFNSLYKTKYGTETGISSILNNMNQLKYGIRENLSLTENVSELIIRKGDLKMLNYGIKRGLKLSSTILEDTINKTSNLKLIKILYRNGCEITVESIKNATENIKILKFLCDNYGGDISDEEQCEICATASSNNDIKCLKYLHSLGYEWDYNVPEEAVINDNLEILEYAVNRGCEGSDNSLSHLFLYGRRSKKCIKKLIDQGLKFNECVIEELLREGRYKDLLYVTRIGCEIETFDLCVDAAHGGNLDCLKFAYAEGGNIDESVVIEASSYGHYDCLKYAVEKGGDVTHRALEVAEENGHIGCLEYLRNL